MVLTASYEIWGSSIVAGGDLGDPVGAGVGRLVYNEPIGDSVVLMRSCVRCVGAFVTIPRVLGSTATWKVVVQRCHNDDHL
jgi:hypothetical protein